MTDVDKDEAKHFRQIVRSFRNYKDHATRRVAYALKQFHELPERHKIYLEDFEENCRKLLECVDSNYQIIEMILEHVDGMFENAKRDTQSDEDEIADKYIDMDSVYTTLRQIVRDWSLEGQSERQACYKPILDELRSLYPDEDSRKSEDISVLVPGAGLGRLAFEIANMGFRCQGNEFSLHMLMTSNFILNQCTESNQFTIHPYIRNWCNNLKFEDQAAAIRFPDMAPPEVTIPSLQFSMSAGDFLEIYTQKDEWDCVTTSFFIDTAHNIIEYIERIAMIIKPGGFWINIGPLMYFNNSSVENSIELNYEQVRRIIERLGLVYLKEETNITCKYNENKRSMLQYSYNCVFFVVQKPPIHLENASS